MGVEDEAEHNGRPCHQSNGSLLEAVHTDLVFTISLKRSTQNLQLSTSCRPITPSFGGKATVAGARPTRIVSKLNPSADGAFTEGIAFARARSCRAATT